MNENSVNDELNKSKKKFITNIIFGQKLINNLSLDKKKEINMEYFLCHLKNFKKQFEENWSQKINYEKYIDLIPQNIEEKLNNKIESLIKNKNYYIEPYCKKPIKILSPLTIFKKNGFHYKLIKLESQYYDLFAFLYMNDLIIGYICCGKKNSSNYKNLYITIFLKYEPKFFDNKNKKLSIINDITEEISFFEKECYQKYIKSFRNIIFSILFDTLSEYKSIKNIVCIGEEEGGNILQLFIIDFLNNKNEINIKIPENLSLYLFTNNTAMLSTESFYNDLVSYLSNGNNSMITFFTEKNKSFFTWDIDESKKKLYNILCQHP